jgi:hypothetical protein
LPLWDRLPVPFILRPAIVERNPEARIGDDGPEAVKEGGVKVKELMSIAADGGDIG